MAYGLRYENLLNTLLEEIIRKLYIEFCIHEKAENFQVIVCSIFLFENRFLFFVSWKFITTLENFVLDMY